jgi:hypothetical protein
MRLDANRAPVRWPLLPAFAAMATLIACAPEPRPPAVNSAPTRLLRVHGTADESLTIRISTRYTSSADECKVSTQGRRTAQSRWVDSTVSRARREYAATVALDHFQPGECGWHAFVIAFHVTNRDGLSTGHFATGSTGATHVPGPEDKVWISAPGGSRSAGDREPRRGADFIRPLQLLCSQNVMRGASGLSCVPGSPRELPLLAMTATEVRVDFVDKTQRATMTY